MSTIAWCIIFSVRFTEALLARDSVVRSNPISLATLGWIHECLRSQPNASLAQPGHGGPVAEPAGNPMPNITLERAAGSHSLATAAQRER